MRSKLNATLFVGFAGLLTMSAACGDDTSTSTTSSGSGGSGGAAGTGGSASTTSGSTGSTQAGPTTGTQSGSSSSGQGGDTTSAGGNGQGGDTTSAGGNGQGGDTTSAGGNGQGGDTTSAGGNGQGGDTTSAGGNGQGGDTTSAGGGNPGCTAITLDDLGFTGTAGDGANVFASTVSPQVDGADEDYVGALFYDETAGTYDLAAEGDLNECLYCVLGNVDVDSNDVVSKYFYQQSGSLTLEAGSDLQNGLGSFSLTDVTLVEVTIDGNTGVTTPVPGGECLFLASASYSFEVPDTWICPDGFYTDADCDCGCGAQDPVCQTTNDVAECEYCTECRDDFETFVCDGFVDPSDTTACLVQGTTAATTSAVSSGGGGQDFVVDSGAINVAIPDADVDGVFVDFSSSTVGTIASIDSVVVTLDHTYAGDLTVYIVSPDGGTAYTQLLANPVDGVGDASANFSLQTPITFSESAPTASSQIGAGLTSLQVIGQSGPASYSPQPDDSFSFLAGAAANGTWSLFVADDASGDTGSVRRVVVNGTLQ